MTDDAHSEKQCNELLTNDRAEQLFAVLFHEILNLVLRSARKGDFYWYADQHKHSDLLFADIHKIHYTHSGHMQCMQILQTLHYQHQEFTIRSGRGFSV